MQTLTGDLTQIKEICAICPSRELADNIMIVCREKGYRNINAFVAVLDDGLKAAKIAEENGARVLVSRKGTADMLEKHSGMQVVNILTTMNDYIRYLCQPEMLGKKIGIVEYRTYIPELERLCEYIGREDIKLYGYGGSAEYDRISYQAINDDNEILLGGGKTLKDLARERGLQHYIVENTLESIRYALDMAQQLLNMQEQERQKNLQYKLTSERLSLVLDNSSNGIMSTDKSGVISVANQAALKILQRSEQQAIGRRLDIFIPELKTWGEEDSDVKLFKIREELISVERVPLYVEKQVEGSLYVLRSVRDLQRNERNIRMQLHKKGHVARYNFGDIIGESIPIQKAKRIAASYAKSDATILIRGETGTGKELFAHSIHNASNRASGPFVAINCASLGKDLLESQLFGYVEGAFTGAAKGGHPGLFEIAHRGTIFLDEIGELPIETQTQLLRVLQEKEVRRVGGDYILPVDVRVIAATNRNLAAEVEQGRFRKDLYYRINVLNVYLPPLRALGNDAALIAEKYLQDNFPDYCDYVMRLFRKNRLCGSYQWPGNVRELLGVMERIMALLLYGDSEELDAAFPDVQDLGQELGEYWQELPPAQAKSAPAISREALIAALEECGYSRSRTAEALGCSRSTLWRYMKSYGLG